MCSKGTRSWIFVFVCFCPITNICSTYRDGSESEQSSKKRKITSQVVVDQPASENKIVVDSVVDNTLNMEEVRNSHNYFFNQCK